MVQKLRPHELRTKSKDELLKQLQELKDELFQLGVAKVTGGNASKLMRIRVVKKDIARVLTIINEKQRKEIRKLFAGKKYKPLDLRNRKKTRAQRLALTKDERSHISLRLRKKLENFPVRKYALKA
eukprot:GEZU01036380.1.p1 GENE.GEZU01036380.1~~GEZU01036380.1.p1  ORF type:complete len:139 (+),score=62.12 GEZU01036380.1:41-418(+)